MKRMTCLGIAWEAIKMTIQTNQPKIINHTHLTQQDRNLIQEELEKGSSLKRIAEELAKDPSTIAKEILKHREIRATSSFNKGRNSCKQELTCRKKDVCPGKRCTISCRFCDLCNKYCPDYEKEVCKSLKRSPHVCNGCEKKTTCRRERYFYNGDKAHKAYALSLSESRAGISLSEGQLDELDALISPLVNLGQSLSHIFLSHKDKIPCSRSCLYHYIDTSVLSCRNIDLQRKVRFKKRRKASKRIHRDYKCRIGRTYTDFQEYITLNPDVPIVEMDTVEGNKGGKVLLTLLFRPCRLMLGFIMPHKSSKCVLSVFEWLEATLGHDLFLMLFPLILTDNGSEFLNAEALEKATLGVPQTKLFYCDPQASYQKGAIEKNHTYIRLFLPKGKSFDDRSQAEITLMFNHINSIKRDVLNGNSPIDLAKLLLPAEALKKLGLRRINPDEVMLKPDLFNK